MPADATGHGLELRGGRLHRGGAPWFPVGVNYHPSRSGVRWLVEWSEPEVTADLDAISAADLDCIRIFVYWADLEPLPGVHDPAVLERLQRVGELAAGHGLAVVCSILTVWMNGERFLPDWLAGLDLWRDPVALDHAEAAATGIAGALAAAGVTVLFDLGDEVPHVDRRAFDLTREEVGAWQERLAGALRRGCPGSLVLQANEASAVFGRHPFGPDNQAGLDLCGLHGFPLWGPASIGSHASPLASQLVPFLVRYARAYGAVLVDEIGAYLAGPEVAARYLQASLPAVAAAGAGGVLAWSWTDITAPGRPFAERPSERSTGVVDARRRPRPTLAALSALARDARQVWARCAPAPAAVALFVPERARAPERTYLQAAAPAGTALFHADVLCTRAHLPHELTTSPAAHHRLVICPSASRLTESDRIALHDAVQHGATLLVTLGEPLHGFPGRALTGVELVDFCPGSRHGELAFDGASYPLRWTAGQRAAVVEAVEAEVLAWFDDGAPALTRRRLGRGEVWFLAAPFEAQLDDPVHIDAAPWHRLYAGVADRVAGLSGRPACAAPDVELAPLLVDGQRRLLAVNHGVARVVTVLTGTSWPAGETIDLGAKSASLLAAPAAVVAPRAVAP